eukprot:NODE_248_length_11794_cov_0.876015.p2 type:complete len:785 gc:universal NODE_248_length_11794_cov_0.876015:4327-1973(-)
MPVDDFLLDMIASADYEAVDKYIAKNRGSLNKPVPKMKAPASFYAVLLNQPAILRRLLDEVDINARDQYNNTAVHYASAFGNDDCLRILLDRGANRNLVNDFGELPLDVSRTAKTEMMLLLTHVQQESQFEEIKKKLPRDVELVSKSLLQIVAQYTDFKDTVKSQVKHLIREKLTTEQKIKILENVAGVENGETRLMDYVQYLQDMLATKDAQINFYKNKHLFYERETNQNVLYYSNLIKEFQSQHQHQLDSLKKKAFEQKGKPHSGSVGSSNSNNLNGNIPLQLSLNIEDKPLFSTDLTHSIDENKETSKFKSLSRSTTNNEPTTPTLIRKNTTSSDKESKIDSAVAVSPGTPSEAAEKIRHLEAMVKSLEEHRNQLQEQLIHCRTNIKKELLEQLRSPTKEEEEQGIIIVENENALQEVKGGTPSKLVQRLLQCPTYDSIFIDNFFLTYREFTTPQFVLDELEAFFNIIVKDQETHRPVYEIRLRDILCHWIKNYWDDFANNVELRSKLKDIITIRPMLSADKQQKVAELIKKNDTLTGIRTMATPILLDDKSQSRLKPILPKQLAKRYGIQSENGPVEISRRIPLGDSFTIEVTVNNFNTSSDDYRVNLLEIDAVEIARQISLIEFELFSQLKAEELIQKSWMASDKEKKAPNLIRMAKFSNHLIMWFVSEIVNIKDIKVRTQAIEKLILIAQALEKLRNYNGVKEVLAALSHSALHRMKKTKAGISNKIQQIHRDLNTLMSTESNFKNLRKCIREMTLPCIPFPGIIILRRNCTKRFSIS